MTKGTSVKGSKRQLSIATGLVLRMRASSEVAGLVLLLVVLASPLPAATYEMELISNADSRWLDLFSAAWVEAGTNWNGDTVRDGFYGIASEPPFTGGNYDPNTFDPTTFEPIEYIEIGGGVDAFPNYPEFSIANYSVDFDDSQVTGVGVETAPITGFDLNFSQDVVIDIVGATSQTWLTSEPQGTVTLTNGSVSAIDGTTTVTTPYDLTLVGVGIVNYQGTFSVSGDRWDLFVDWPPPGDPARAARMVWDLHGSLDNLATMQVDGDFNDDQAYDCSDVDSLVAAIASNSSDLSFDLNGDGTLDQGDVNAWLAEAGAVNLASGQPYLPGDANLDGSVDVSDFNVWNSNKFSSVAAWCSADFNADGVV
ncbi:MAG: hypothetical protein AAF497_11780, partial [Planctomycetota bacterium]